jgi:hypothetical protein
MRMRRHFQPMLDSMPIRIAPAAVGGLTQVVAPMAATPQLATLSTYNDTEAPTTTHSSPIILAPVISPPHTLPC